MQMESVETKAGIAISRSAVQNRLLNLLAHFKIPVDVFDFDGGIVDQDSDRQGKPAEGHDVDGLAQKLSTMRETRTESGIETAMINVLRQLPRKTRIMIAVRQAAIIASTDHIVDGGADKNRLVVQRTNLQLRRQGRFDLGRILRIWATMSSVDTLPDFFNGHQRGALTVHAYDVGLRRKPVPHVRHISNVDGGAIDRLDGKSFSCSMVRGALLVSI